VTTVKTQKEHPKRGHLVVGTESTPPVVLGLRSFCTLSFFRKGLGGTNQVNQPIQDGGTAILNRSYVITHYLNNRSDSIL